MSKLHIADGLSLPIDATTQALAFLGRRGSGKTYAATKLAELFYKAGAQFVALDPVGVWYGLRLDADRKSKGLEIPIFGGLHGDIPLEPTGGALLADVVVERGVSAVIDVSQFESDAQKARFARDFGARFFFLKKSKPSAVHLFIEEAQEFVPQNPQAEETQMLHAYQRMVRLGRNYGIGVSLISQRPQEVHKKVLNQAECVFAFQLTGPHERKAVSDWVSDKGLDEDITDTLPKLQTGHAHVWSPAWLEVSKEVLIAEKWTYSAGSTPVVGAKPVEVKALAPVDLEQLHADMKATIERAKAEDPRELRKKLAEQSKRIAELEKAKAPKAPASPAVDQKAVRELERAWQVKEKEWQRQLRTAHAKLAKVVAVAGGGEVAASEPAPMPVTRIPVAVSSNGHAAHVAPVARAPMPTRRQARTESEAGDEALGKCERAILAVLSQHPEGCTSGKLTLLAGYRYSGGFKNSLSELRTRGLITGENTGIMRITDEGMQQANADALPTGAALRDYWLNHRSFGACERRILAALLEHPDGMTAEQLCEATNYQYSGGFKNSLSALRTAGVVVGKNTETMRVTEDLL